MERFLNFLINFLFLKILAFLAQKTEILVKKWENIPWIQVFRWLSQIFGDFLFKNIFFTLVKTILGQKITFLTISQKYDF